MSLPASFSLWKSIIRATETSQIRAFLRFNEELHAMLPSLLLQRTR